MKDINIIMTIMKATFILLSTSLGTFYTLFIERSIHYTLHAVSIVSILKVSILRIQRDSIVSHRLHQQQTLDSNPISDQSLQNGGYGVVISRQRNGRTNFEHSRTFDLLLIVAYYFWQPASQDSHELIHQLVLNQCCDRNCFLPSCVYSPSFSRKEPMNFSQARVYLVPVLLAERCGPMSMFQTNLRKREEGNIQHSLSVLKRSFHFFFCLPLCLQYRQDGI